MALMIEPSVRRRRRRHSREFKARVVAASQQPGASVSGIALANGLNANLVRRWIKEAKAKGPLAPTPQFVALTSPEEGPKIERTGSDLVRITLPRVGGAVVIEWPSSEPTSCAAFLQALVR